MDARKKHLASLDPWSTYDDLNQQQQQMANSSNLDYDAMIRKQMETIPLTQMNFIQQQQQLLEVNDKTASQSWDPKTMLSNLNVMEQKIHQLQELVQLIVGKSSMNQPNQLLIQQQQLVTADLTSIIIQLISTAGSLLPSVKHPHFSPITIPNPSVGNGVNVSNSICNDNINTNSNNNNNNNNNYSDSNTTHRNMVSKVEDQSHDTDHMDTHEEHEDDVDDGEHLPPGSYEILQLEKEEILAPHTHFCVICGKGFKRDANLRMHMRGHGDEYKTAAALAKPHKEMGSEPKLIKRYSCPYLGCKRNKDHKKFRPLKTILCVKNHYKRTHCDKSYTCSRCNTKKFSVIADLKTHEKHCGRDRWLCSCGTTFSRKDKLFGHISLFQGHTPAIPLDEPKGGPVSVQEQGDTNNNNVEGPKDVGFFDFNFNSNGASGSGIQISGDLNACFSPMNGFQEFPRSLFEESDSLSFLLPSGSYLWKNGGESSSRICDDDETL
nr:protein sensitive to proton rhizotoxicity 1 [Tanacetum cinerariifolium]